MTKIERKKNRETLEVESNGKRDGIETSREQKKRRNPRCGIEWKEG